MSDHTRDDHRVPATPEGAFDLRAAGDELLDAARANDSGRAARTLTPGEGATLKQTMMALLAGRELSEHRSPGPATLVVVRGRVTLTWEGRDLEVDEAHWAAIPQAVHTVRAEADTVMLLTVAS